MGASPQDRGTLAPVDVREHGGWLRAIRGVFQIKHMDTRAEARGQGDLDLNPLLSSGYVYATQRGAVAVDTIGQGSRGHQDPIPTPQALIRQVTGVGDPAKGR
jgi:hypothetical protein